MGRLFKYSKNEIIQLIVGILAAIANGCTFPVFSLFLSEMIVVLI